MLRTSISPASPVKNGFRCARTAITLSRLVWGARLIWVQRRYSSQRKSKGTFFSATFPVFSSRASSSRRRFKAACFVFPATSRYFSPRKVTQTYQRDLPSRLIFLYTRLTHDLPKVDGGFHVPYFGRRDPSRVTRSP